MKSMKTLGIAIAVLSINSIAQATFVAPDCWKHTNWGAFIYEVKEEENMNAKLTKLSFNVKKVDSENKISDQSEYVADGLFARDNMFFVKPATEGQKWSLAIRDDEGTQITIGTVEETVAEPVEYWDKQAGKYTSISMTCHRLQLINNLNFKQVKVGRKWSAGGVALIIPVAGTTEQISLQLTAFDTTTGSTASVLADPHDGAYRLLGIFNTSGK